MKTNQMTYRQAMGELKNHRGTSTGRKDVDVDELVVDVARAKELIDFCGAKVKKADAAIKGIVSELQTAEGTNLAVVTSGRPSRNGDGAEDIPF